MWHVWAETAPYLLLTLDAHGVIQTANPAAGRAWQCAPAALTGARWLDLLDAGSRAKAQMLINQALNNGQADNWELDHAPLAGSAPALYVYAAHRLETRPPGVGLLGRERAHELPLVAQLAEANQQLEGALLRLERAQTELVHAEKMRALGQLVAGVAHEINNPLAYILNNHQQLAETLSTHPAPTDTTAWAEVADILQENRAGLERIRQLVLTLRRFAHVDERTPQPADLNAEVRAACRLARALAPDRVTLAEEYAPNLPPVTCFPGELNQLFLNVIINAVQAIPHTGTVTVQTTALPRHARVTVRDDGVGMDTATLARLGEPFFTTKPAGEGTGLGLAIAQTIARRHAAELRFASAPGAGTQVTLEIPYHVNP